VENFLPLYSSVRRWQDRRVQLQLPLFPGYVFVHLALSDRLRVLQVPGVAKLVGFGGQPVALPDEQLEALRVGLNLNLPYFFDYQRHGQHLMLTSKDHLEGAKSFVEKRAANFKGE